MRFSLSQLLSDLSADAATIIMDRDSGLYDKAHRALQKSGASDSAQKVGIGVTLLAHRVVKQQVVAPGPITNFLGNVSASALRQIARRILDKNPDNPGTITCLKKE